MTTNTDYEALCIHGPGSPDRCGHPDCTGARWTRPAGDDHEDIEDVPTDDEMLAANALLGADDDLTTNGS